MNINKHVTTDNLDVAPPPQVGPWSITPHQPRATWDVVAARGVIALLAGLVGWWLLPPVATYAALAIGAAWAIKRFILTDRIGGVEIRTWRNDVRATDIVGPLGMAAIAHAQRALPNVSSYSPSVHQLPAARGQVVEAQVVESPALIAPINVGPLTLEEWLTQLDEQPHAIFAARTKGGKSTMAKLGLRARVERGEAIFVIDPHSNGWLDLPGVGGGLNWPEVEAGMLTVLHTYRARMEEREHHMRETGRELPHDHFPRLTVVLDEANESRTMIERLHDKKTNPWPLFLEIMGSGARKVGISLWLICQSALIKNLGGSVTMRRNFTVFALDHATIIELIEDEEPLKARREAIIAQIGGQPFPAAAVFGGQAYLLDRAGIDRQLPPSAADCAWAGWDYAARRPRTMPRVAAHATRSATLRTSEKTPDSALEGGSATRSAPRSAADLNEAQRDELVRILRRRRDARGRPMAQDAIRQQLERVGLTIAQRRLVDLCQEVDAQVSTL